MPGVNPDKLAEMMLTYETSLIEKCNELSNEFNDFVNSPADDQRRNKLAMQTHTLKGGGSTFGYHLISIVATTADDIFNSKTI